jgi:hypothetical protein
VKGLPNKPVRWPKTKSQSELRAMTRRQALRYAMRLHECHAEEHRRAMEWDLYWVGFYKQELKARKT